MTLQYTISWSDDVTQAPLQTRPMPSPTPAAGRGAKHLRWAIGGAVLVVAAGCATQDTRSAPQWRIDPVFNVSHSVDAQASLQYYALGQHLDESRAWDRSVDAYRMAVAADAHNVEAVNALGVTLARLGRYADAEATLRQAIALAPERTSIRNNLGYVLMLMGKPADAAVELKSAVALNDKNTIALANLREAQTRAGLPGDDLPAPVVAAPAIPVPEAPPLAAVSPEAPQVADATTAAPPPPLDGARLEVSNGNGRTGMATQVSTWLAARGIPTAHVTNWPTFDQPKTVIQFRVGHEDAAHRLAGLLPAPATPDAKPTPGLRTDVRVVLGRDWTRATPCLAAGTCPPKTPNVRIAAE